MFIAVFTTARRLCLLQTRPMRSPSAICIAVSSHTCHMHNPSHSSSFDCPCVLQILKLLSLTLSLSDPNIFLSTLFQNTLSLIPSPSATDQVLHPYAIAGAVVLLSSSHCRWLPEAEVKLKCKANESAACLNFGDENISETKHRAVKIAQEHRRRIAPVAVALHKKVQL